MRVSLRFVRGKRVGVATTGRTDPEALSRLAETAGRISDLVEETADWTGLPEPGPIHLVAGAFAEGTAALSPELRAEGVRAVIAAADAAGVMAYGSFATSVETVAIANSRGIRAAEARTGSQLITVSMGPEDGTGYAEAAAVDATTIDAGALGREAAETRPALRAAGRARAGRLPGRARRVRGRRHPGHARLPGLQRPRGGGGPLLLRAGEADRERPRQHPRRRR